jgi:hypothetical protein
MERNWICCVPAMEIVTCRNHRQPDVVVAGKVHGLLDVLDVLRLDHEVRTQRPLQLLEDAREGRSPDAVGGPPLVAEKQFTPSWRIGAVRRQSSVRERWHNSNVLDTRGGQEGQPKQES